VLTLTQKDRDRLVILRQLADGTLKVGEAARCLGLSARQVRRLRRRFEAAGDAAVIHRLRGQPSNRRLPEPLRARALAKAREPLYHDFGPTLLSEHLARDPEIGYVHPTTLRLWMIQDGLWSPRKRKKRHRRWRERRPCVGEMVLMDTSEHPWLEERFNEKIVLIAMIDDASSRLYCRFFPRDTGAANRRLLIDYMQRFGRMGALYVDKAGHFKALFNESKRQEQDMARALTVIQRALAALEIRLIHALSPQAKGRVERLFGTLQNRLIKEMRVARINCLNEANRFLDDEFIPFWNNRFTVQPASAVDAHLPLPDDVDLQQIFAETHQRVVRNDFTFRFKNQHYQIERADTQPTMPGSRVVIELRVDGSMQFRWREHYLNPTPLLQRPPAKPMATEPARPREAPARRPVPPNHPWRRNPLVVGKGFKRARSAVTSAPAALQPDSPPPVEYEP